MTISPARAQAAATARRWLSNHPLFLDTETTGFADTDQICEIAVLDAAGAPLLDTLVRPLIPIPHRATLVHGLADHDVAFARPFDAIWPELDALLRGRHVVIYNAPYDLRLVVQSLLPYNIVPKAGALASCAMTLFAKWNGEWNPDRGGWKWYSLDAAAAIAGLPRDAQRHRARADAELCRQILLHIAQGADQ